MADYGATLDAFSDLADVVDAIASPDFFDRVATFCEKASGCNSTVVALFQKGHRPRHVFNNLGARDENRTIRPYVDGPYLLDPFYTLMVGGFSDGTYLLSDITPDEFEGTEYFNLYYRRTRLLDEVGVLISLSENRHMLVSMGHRDGDAGAPRTDKLIACQPFLAAACRKHWALRKPDAPEEDVTFAIPLESVYQNFGRDLLSDREREVMLLLLRGHSSKSMAQRMGISPETVKVHRRNLYTKVDVASQAELFSVFLDSLAGVRIGSQEDPLARYNQI